MSGSKVALTMIAMVIGVTTSSACFAGEGPYNGHTRNWFEKNPKAMVRQLNWCNNHGEQKNPMATTCVSAQNAKVAIKRKAEKPQVISGASIWDQYNKQFSGN